MKIFDRTDGDLEQLATFMGHTLNIPKNPYGTSEAYQTAKISNFQQIKNSIIIINIIK